MFSLEPALRRYRMALIDQRGTGRSQPLDCPDLQSIGELSTVTDREGRERLTSVAYEATVMLDEQSGRLCAGMRGRSRFLVGHRSSWQWVSRWYRQTFNFRL